MEQYQKSFAIYVICMCIVIARMENGESANPDEEADKQVKYLVTVRKSVFKVISWEPGSLSRIKTMPSYVK